MKAIQQLTKMAGSLEKNGLVRTSGVLDRIAANVLRIVQAQYVGVQGWAVRNSRCWANCYRQKRASNPDMPTQVVWSECQSEYVDYVRDGGDKWGKYAEEDASIKKYASTHQKLSQDVVAYEIDSFHKRASKRLKAGCSVERSIFDTLRESNYKYKFALYREAGKVLDIADRMNAKGQETMAKTLAQCAKAIVDHANRVPGQK